MGVNANTFARSTKTKKQKKHVLLALAVSVLVFFLFARVEVDDREIKRRNMDGSDLFPFSSSSAQSQSLTTTKKNKRLNDNDDDSRSRSSSSSDETKTDQKAEVRGHGMSRDRYKDSHITMAQKLLLTKPPRPFTPKCFDAPKPWRPLEEIEEWRRRKSMKRRRVLFDDEYDSTNTTTNYDRDSNNNKKKNRKLTTFKAAGMGGKFGPSCSPRAPLKARQACAEQRALKRCSDESKVTKKKADQLSEHEKKLKKCLVDLKGCEATRDELRKVAIEFSGIQTLSLGNPTCFVHSKGKCAPLAKNEETGLLSGGCGERGGGPKAGCDMTSGWEDRVPTPKEDVFKGSAYDRCAVVGNSMNLFDAENGDAIDQYDAVFRFNSEWRRMHHVMKEKGVKFEDKQKYMGTKTTFRLVNRKYTTSLLDGDGASEDISSDEEVLFWNYFSAPYLEHLQKKHPKLNLHLAAADLVNWELEVFSQLRKDLYMLGLGPFECYRFMSSGVHGVLMALKMCEEVDLFGFSVSMDNFAKSFNHGRPSESHSWEFETMMMRLLYFTGAINVCNS
jgi:hypothetical protein